MTLLVLCGQVLASPFLACTAERMVTAEITMEEHCAGMLMMSATESMDMDMQMEDQELQSISENTPSLTDDTIDRLDCESICQFCRGINAFEELKPIALFPPFFISLTVSRQSLAPPAQPPGNHFRPPTFA